MQHSDAKLEAAALLLSCKATQVSANYPFTLTSGKKSPVYVDCRRPISYTVERTRLMELMVEKANSIGEFDIIAGGETAGIPYAAFLAERMQKPMVYIRKEAKKFGKGQRIEGSDIAGKKVLLVEDMATDGGSKRSFFQGLHDAGAVCSHCLVLFQYGIFPDQIAALNSEGLYIHSLAEWSDILQLIEANDMYPQAEIKVIKEFLENPSRWQANN